MRKKIRNIYLTLAGLFKNPQPGIHIINSHYVSPEKLDKNKHYEMFEAYLKYLSRFGKFITLEDASKRILENNIPEKEILIAFTFDDGFEECYSIIAPLLEKYNTRGTFFINANYIESSKEYQEEFNKRILTFTKSPMNWAQVLDLHSRGHLIGSHNIDHVNFSEISAEEIDNQLRANVEILENRLKYKCDYFAWTYGQLKHFPKNAVPVVRKYHKYIFSATNYKAYFSYGKEVINRRHQEAFWPKLHLKYFMSCKKDII